MTKILLTAVVRTHLPLARKQMSKLGHWMQMICLTLCTAKRAHLCVFNLFSVFLDSLVFETQQITVFDDLLPGSLQNSEHSDQTCSRCSHVISEKVSREQFGFHSPCCLQAGDVVLEHEPSIQFPVFGASIFRREVLKIYQSIRDPYALFCGSQVTPPKSSVHDQDSLAAVVFLSPQNNLSS